MMGFRMLAIITIIVIILVVVLASRMGKHKRTRFKRGKASKRLKVEVIYPSGRVVPGSGLSQKETSQAPNIVIKGNPKVSYTLTMSDPDAPVCKGKACEWNHWVVVDMPGGTVSKGREVVKYAGPSPPAKTGPHRYFVRVYAQRGLLNIERSYFGSRAKYDPIDFEQDQNLELLSEMYFVVAPTR